MTDQPRNGRLRRIANDWRWWAIFFGSIFALYQAAPAVGLTLPRWTWWGEFQARKKEVDLKFVTMTTAISENSLGQLQIRRDVLRGQLWQVEREIRRRLQANQPVPESLYRERARLRDAIETVKNQLRRGRSR